MAFGLGFFTFSWSGTIFWFLDWTYELVSFVSLSPRLDSGLQDLMKCISGSCAKPVSNKFESSWPSYKVLFPEKRETLGPFLKKEEKERPRELQTDKPQFCSWENNGADPHGNNVKAYPRKGGDPRQPAWLHKWKIIPDQFGSFPWYGASIGQQGKITRCHLPRFCKPFERIPLDILICKLDTH